MKPLCFVLMPFGRKAVGSVMVDFDAVYRELIAPSVAAAGLTPLRADEEQGGGMIHKQMFERLLLCDYALADLSGSNANVYYELGVRHAARPRSTVLIFAANTILPFDLGLARATPYRLDEGGAPADVTGDREQITRRLRAARRSTSDSPLYEMLENYPAIDHTKTDTFRDRVDYSRTVKEKLRAARAQGFDAVQVLEQDMGDLGELEGGVVIDLLLSYRAVATGKDPRGYQAMVRLAQDMPAHLGQSALVREQTALALNRLGRRAEAADMLDELIRRRGPSSEACGLLGRVRKDEWEELLKAGRTFQARDKLDQAIKAYRQGFETDWRDAFPGINAVTLMELREPPDPEREKMLPVVRFAVERRLADGQSDYWDHATLVELAVLAHDHQGAEAALGAACNALREAWEAETTVRNLRLIREARHARGQKVGWLAAIEKHLLAAAAERAGGAAVKAAARARPARKK